MIADQLRRVVPFNFVGCGVHQNFIFPVDLNLIGPRQLFGSVAAKNIQPFAHDARRSVVSSLVKPAFNKGPLVAEDAVPLHG